MEGFDVERWKESILDGRYEETEELILKGVDVNMLWFTSRKLAAIHISVRYPDEKSALLHLLLRYGADVNLVCGAGLRPLYVCKSDERMQLLLKAKADANAKTPNLNTAYHRAARKGFVASLKTMLSIQDGLFDERNRSSHTPLFVALQFKQLECARLLVAHGAKTRVLEEPKHKKKHGEWLKPLVLTRRRCIRSTVVFYGILRKRMRYQHDMARVLASMVLKSRIDVETWEKKTRSVKK